MADAVTYVIGIDLGGTKVRIAVVSLQGGLVQAETWPTLGEQGPEAVLGTIRNGVQQLLRQAGAGGDAVRGAGLGAPGPLDIHRGTVSVLPNLPGWQGFPLRDRVAGVLGMPVALGNDGNAGALGEHRFGAGRGTQDMVYVTLGTGVGGGIIAGGRLLVGAVGAAGEIGHMVLDPQGPPCSCGRRGCLEAYAAGSGLQRRATLAAQSGRPTMMSEIAATADGAITPHVIQQAARQGDALAQEVLAEAATYLGWGLVSLVHCFNPELVVFGGGLLALRDDMIEPAIALAREQVFEQHRQGLRFAYAGLGEDAGVLGAAALALDAFCGR
ncbi:MAG: ROK family protein [Chloroflexi bacterium]|nr:ROK family protein [Chloroflexota bacterium]